MSIEARLEAQNITLPAAAAPAANYLPYVQSGSYLYISGQLPFDKGDLKYIGTLGADFNVEQGAEAARLCAINIMAQINAACAGDLSKVKRIVKLGIFVNSTADFTDQPKVGNGASDLLADIFQEAGRHARSAVSAPSLPLGVAVEIDAIVELTD